MSNSNRRSSKRDSLKKVFRASRRQPKKSIIRQFFEAILMLSIGITLLSGLNQIPQEVDILEKTSDTFSALLSGLIEVFTSLVTIGSGLILGGLMIFGLVLLLGGLWRLLRVISLFIMISSSTNKSRRVSSRLRR